MTLISTGNHGRRCQTPLTPSKTVLIKLNISLPTFRRHHKTFFFSSICQSHFSAFEVLRKNALYKFTVAMLCCYRPLHPRTKYTLAASRCINVSIKIEQTDRQTPDRCFMLVIVDTATVINKLRVIALLLHMRRFGDKIETTTNIGLHPV